MTKEGKPEIVELKLRVTKDLQKRFKAHCAINNVSMTRKMTELMERQLYYS